MLYRHIQPLTDDRAIAIGNFDGMHLGHKHIISNLIAIAKAKGLRSCVILFEPQPQQFFAKDHFLRIMSFRDKYAILTQMGVDDVICLKFNAKLAKISHQDFYEEILKNKLNMQALIIGHDFHFGKDRLGDIAFIKNRASLEGLFLEVIEPELDNADIISSSKIRELMQQNNLAKCEKLLGGLYTISAKVMHGKKLATQLGFKTANLALSDNMVINNGVYVVKTNIMGKIYYGVASIGVRPTIGGTPRLLEVHLFGDVGDIYGVRISVGFIQFLRPEQNFKSLDELKTAIEKDVKMAQQAIKSFIIQR